jgi:hypothetical protein
MYESAIFLYEMSFILYEIKKGQTFQSDPTLTNL